MLSTKATLVLVIGIGAYYYMNKGTPEDPKLPSPVVDTNTGKVQGVVSQSRAGRDFYEFLGIPFAQPPVGNLRFEPPKPVEKWNGILSANTTGPACLQMDIYMAAISGDEDCLFLNVYTPKIDTDKPLSVLVWIHGGMFHIGEGASQGPDYFMDEDVVLVNLNYRLGALGFLSTGDSVIRGNNGLKDQNLALRWIKNNIVNFGGDPNKITIFGESAGGASVHLHVVSPLSKGLFAKAISESGVVNNPWAIRRNPGAQAKRFGEKLKCSTRSTQEMVDCLKAASPMAILNAGRDVAKTLRDPISTFVPTIESVNDKDAFLAEDPVEILKQGRANKVPWMTGVNSEEGLLSTAPLIAQSLFEEVETDWDRLLPLMLWYSGPSRPDAMAKITKFYVGSAQDLESPDKFVNLTNLFTDRIFTQGTHEAVRMQAKHSPVYLYYYTYKGSFSITNLLLALKLRLPPKIEFMIFFGRRWIERNVFGRVPHHYGAAHFDEVPLLFPLGKRGSYIGLKDNDYEMSRDLVRTWVAFSKDEKTMRFKGREWPAVAHDAEPLKYFHLDSSQPRVIDEPFAERVAFWKSLNLQAYQ